MEAPKRDAVLGQQAVEGEAGPGHVSSGHPAPGHRHGPDGVIGRFAAQEMGRPGAVPGGKDIRMAGLHGGVHRQAEGIGEAGARQEFQVGRHAHRQEHRGRRELPAVA